MTEQVAKQSHVLRAFSSGLSFCRDDIFLKRPSTLLVRFVLCNNFKLFQEWPRYLSILIDLVRTTFICVRPSSRIGAYEYIPDTLYPIGRIPLNLS